MLHLGQLIGYWARRRKLRLSLGCTSLAAVLAAVLTVPGPKPVTIAPPNPAGLTIKTTQPDAAATVGKPRFAQTPPKVKPGDPPPQVYSGDGIPTIALNAYIHAANLLGVSDPTCQITWEDLAGIGRVESDNGQTYGSEARVTPDGTLSPPILGPILDGQYGMPAIPTSDHGLLEYNPVWARAVGPMQFLPSTWFAYAQSGTGVGVPNPENFYDAALTAGTYLCKNGGDLGTPAGITNAIYAYNHSSYYVSVVEQWISFYTAEGANALLAAGQGLITLGNAGSPISGLPGITLETVPSGVLGVSGVVGLGTAAVTSDGAGTFSFGLQLYVGNNQLAKGTASVYYPLRKGTMTLTLNGLGVVQLRVIGDNAWILLPNTLARGIGLTPGQWQVFSENLAGRLPAPDGGAIAFLGRDLVWVIAQFEGGMTDLALEGTGITDGVAATNYLGPINLSTASQLVPAAAIDLGRLAQMIASRRIDVSAWVDHSGLLRSAVLFLPSLPWSTSNGTVTLDLSFYGYGQSVTVTNPTSTTTTSTSTTSTSTSTSTSTTSTSTSTTTPTSSSSTSTTTPTSSSSTSTSSPTTGNSGAPPPAT